jgi:hypothetical protein
MSSKKGVEGSISHHWVARFGGFESLFFGFNLSPFSGAEEMCCKDRDGGRESDGEGDSDVEGERER